LIQFIFPSLRGSAINTSNFLFRVLKEAAKKAGIEGVTHQMLRRTCSTYMAQLSTVKDVQAHLRHRSAKTTLEHYIKVPVATFLVWRATPDWNQPRR
jgi:integrase